LSGHFFEADGEKSEEVDDDGEEAWVYLILKRGGVLFMQKADGVF
jgi:hypothetical protein